MKLESRLQRRIQKLIREEGGWPLKIHGGPFMPAGIPDLLACIGGIFLALEVKTDTGRPSEIQLAIIKKIKRAGGIAAVVSSTKQALAYIQKARRLSERIHTPHVGPEIRRLLRSARRRKDLDRGGDDRATRPRHHARRLQTNKQRNHLEDIPF